MHIFRKVPSSPLASAVRIDKVDQYCHGTLGGDVQAAVNTCSQASGDQSFRRSGLQGVCVCLCVYMYVFMYHIMHINPACIYIYLHTERM